MRKRTISVLLVGAFLLSGFGTAHARTGGPFGCKDIPWQHGPAYVKSLIRCEVDWWNAHRGPGSIPGGVPKAQDVAACESSYRPSAESGQYGGVYQIGALSDRHGEWRDWASSRFWRTHPRANPEMRGRFNGFFNIVRALGHVSWIVHHPGVGPWYGDGWGPWSCG